MEKAPGSLRSAAGGLAIVLLCLPAIGTGRDLAEATLDARDELAGELRAAPRTTP
jgi:hypothetical protein